VYIRDFLRGEVSVKVDVMEFGLYMWSPNDEPNEHLH